MLSQQLFTGFVLITSLNAGLTISLFASRISCRVITMFGGALACISLSCTMFAKEVWHMFLVMLITGDYLYKYQFDASP